MLNSTQLQPGQKLANGRFVLSKPLGRGGMGEVWLANDQRLDEPVALKFLPPEIRGNPVALDSLRSEAIRSHKLTHTHIVRIHDLHEEPDGGAFISMEYVDGPTLEGFRLQQPNRVLAWDYLRPLVQQLCAALEYAHEERVVHRDLKPANMMMDSRGRLRLTDFGVAAVVSDSVSRASQGRSTSGTLVYMSPQQLVGKRPQVTDDVYALGATIYELLASQPPFFSGDITHQILYEAPEPLDERLAALGIQNEIPPDVAALIMACLAKEPAQRPQSARAVAEWVGLETVRKPSLQAMAESVSGPPKAAKAQPPVPQPMRPANAEPGEYWSRRRLAWLGGVLALLVALSAAWLVKTYRDVHLAALPPAAAAFAQMVVLHGPDGTNDMVTLEGAEVTLSLDKASFVAAVTMGCEAHFDSLPGALLGREVSVTLKADDWQLAGGADRVSLNGDTAWVTVEPAGVTVTGVVRDVADEFPVDVARVSFAGMTTNTDTFGAFTFYVPRAQISPKMDLEVAASGFQTYRQSISTPSTPLQIRLQKEPPPPTTFVQRFILHGVGGTNDRVSLEGGQVTFALGRLHRTVGLTNGCEAQIENLPVTLLGQAGTLSLSAADWQVAAASRVKFSEEPVWLAVVRTGLTVTGSVRSLEGERPLEHAHVTLSGLVANTDAAGEFSFRLTGERVSTLLLLEVTATGFSLHRESIMPSEARLDVHLQKDVAGEGPPVATFEQVFIFQSAGSSNEPVTLENARATLEVDHELFQVAVNNGHEARFVGLPGKLQDKAATIKLAAKGWELWEGAGAIRLTGKATPVQVEPRWLTLKGIVRNASDAQPLPLAKVVFAGLATTTDAAGAFSFRAAATQDSKPLSLEVTAADYSPYRSEVAPPFESVEIRLQPSTAATNSGESLLKRAQKMEDLKMPEKAEALYSQAVKDFPDNYECADAYGMFLRAQNRPDEARTYLEKAVASARRAGDNGNLAFALNDQGMVLAGLGRPEQARQCYDEALMLYKQLAAASPERYRNAYAQCLVNRGRMWNAANKFSEARRDFEEAAHLRDELARTGPAERRWEYRADDATVQVSLASTLNALGERAKARDALAGAVRTYRELRNQKPRQYDHDLAVALNEFGRLLQEAGDQKGTGDAYAEAVELYHALKADAPECDYRDDFATALNSYGVFLAQSYTDPDQAKAASAAYGRAIIIYSNLAGMNPGEYQYPLAISLKNLGTLYQETGKDPQAGAAFEQALAGYQRLPAQQQGEHALFKAETLRSLSASLARTGPSDQAGEKFKDAINAFYRLKQNEPNIANLEGLAGAESAYADFLAKDKENAAAREEAKTAYDVARKNYEELSRFKAWTNRREYALALNNYGVHLGNCQLSDQARQQYLEALKVCGNYHYDTLAVQVLNNLATLSKNTGDYATARDNYKTARKLCDQLLAKGELEAPQLEAKTMLGFAGLELLEAAKGDPKSHTRDARSYVAEARLRLGQLAASKEKEALLKTEHDLSQRLLEQP